MTALYTIKVETTAVIDVTVTLDIEAETEAEALKMFEEEAHEEIERLPWGSAEINSTYVEDVTNGQIEIVEVEEYEEDDEHDDDEEDDDDD